MTRSGWSASQQLVLICLFDSGTGHFQVFAEFSFDDVTRQAFPSKLAYLQPIGTGSASQKTHWPVADGPRRNSLEVFWRTRILANTPVRFGHGSVVRTAMQIFYDAPLGSNLLQPFTGKLVRRLIRTRVTDEFSGLSNPPGAGELCTICISNAFPGEDPRLEKIFSGTAPDGGSIARRISQFSTSPFPRGKSFP
ncbi:hypothetical protein C8R47DRAFT_1078197 [Mycena vitilis]|nr:hypothetical protein C8R47DRAFT_1078197 [Mycena vitilis]